MLIKCSELPLADPLGGYSHIDGEPQVNADVGNLEPSYIADEMVN